MLADTMGGGDARGGVEVQGEELRQLSIEDVILSLLLVATVGLLPCNVYDPCCIFSR